MKNRRGFVLLIVIAVVGLVTAMLVGLAASNRVESRAAATAEQMRRVRDVAMYGLKIGLGQLQAHVTEDMVTASAGGVAPNSPNPHFVGVWPSSSTSNVAVWLVNGNERSLSRTPDQTVPEPDGSGASVFVVNRGSTSPNRIKVRTSELRSAVPGYDGEQVVARYAYWIYDESLKISLGLPNTEPFSGYDFSVIPGFVQPSETQRSQMLVPENLGHIGFNISQQINSRGIWHDVTVNTQYIDSGGGVRAGVLNGNSTSQLSWQVALGGIEGLNTASRKSAAEFIAQLPRPFRTADELEVALRNSFGELSSVQQTNAINLLRPRLALRGDTYWIRAYGEILVPGTNQAAGSIYCEARLQRIPLAVTGASGRRFIITHLRWMSADEI